LKHCSSCGREISESLTLCEQCERWAAESVAGPVPDAVPEHVDAPPANVPLPGPRAGLGRRELLMILVAVVVAGLATLAVLSSRGPAAAVAAARVEAPERKPSAPTPAPAAAPPSTVSQKWSSENRTYWVGKQRNAAAFELPAENMVSIWMNQVRPALVVRCMSKSLEVFVFTGSAIKMEAQTEDHTVSFKFDDEPDRTERWPDSAEHDALFAPDQAAFASRLMTARTLRFGYTPHNAEPAVALFQVSGLAEMIEPSAKACGLKK